MRTALLVMIAALMMLGCGAVEYKGKVNTKSSQAYAMTTPVASAGKPAAAIDDPAPQYQGKEAYRPSEHSNAVRNYHKQQHIKARNNDYWTINKVKVDRGEEELRNMIEKKRQAAASGDRAGEESPALARTEKQKKDAARNIMRARESVANTLDDGSSPFNRWRLDVKQSELNTWRMPAHGQIPMQPHDRFISKEECPHMRCMNKARMNKTKMENLGNPAEF